MLWRSWCGVATLVVQRARRFPGLRGTESKIGIPGQIRPARNTYIHLIVSKAPRHRRRTKSRVKRSRWCHDSQTSINALTPTLTLSIYLVENMLNTCVDVLLSSLLAFWLVATVQIAIGKPSDIYTELRGRAVKIKVHSSTLAAKLRGICVQIALKEFLLYVPLRTVPIDVCLEHIRAETVSAEQCLKVELMASLKFAKSEASKTTNILNLVQSCVITRHLYSSETIEFPYPKTSSDHEKT